MHSVPSSAAAGRSPFRRIVAALAFAAAALFGAPAAHAGDATKLLVEFNPQETKSVTCPDTVQIQIVGQDAEKNRVGFSGKTVELSATAGSIEVVKAPYQYLFKTPATLPDVTTVRIRAWLKEAPEVQGEATIEVLPPAPFKRLAWQGAGTNPAGASMDVFLRGETATGELKDVPEGSVDVKVTGPGSITLVKTGRYRFETGADATGTSKIVATLKRYPAVTSTLEVLNTGGSGGSGTPTSPPPAPGTGSGSSGSGGSGGSGSSGSGAGSGTGEKETGGAKPGSDGGKDDPNDYVDWPGGNVRIEVWRVRETAGDKWGKDKDAVKAGADFVSTLRCQKIRIAILKKDVKSVDVDEQYTEKGEVRRVPVTAKLGEGHLNVVERDDGTKVVHYDCEIPENGKRMTMTLTLRVKGGKDVTETFVFRRVDKK